MLVERFDTCHGGYPAKVFESVNEARAFTQQLTELQISFMVHLLQPRKRLDLPMRTVVVLLDSLDHGRYH